jgi:hypothetical protein
LANISYNHHASNSFSGIVAFYDPDGTIIELAVIPWFARILFPIIHWFRDLFD